MNTDNIIVNIKNIEDIEKISNVTKYINISIDNINNDVINYFLLNGKNYLYSDTINNNNGFIYSNYDMFKNGENIINTIICNVPNDLSDIEKIRYVYIYLGKILCSDINIMDDKNEIISFDKVSTASNIWSSLSSRKVSDIVVSKIFMYVCFRLGFKSELISSSIRGNIANKVYVNDTFVIVDLFSDLYNIHAGFSTKYFDKYNDNKDIDKKILYIKDEYMEFYIDNKLKNLDYTKENVVEEVLSVTSNLINVNNIGTYELSNIYKYIFDKYVPNYDIRINNLFIYGVNHIKEHFALFS